MASISGFICLSLILLAQKSINIAKGAKSEGHGNVRKDDALKMAGDVLIAAYPDLYGSITFNLQGKRKTVHANVTSRLAVEVQGRQIEVDKKESKQL